MQERYRVSERRVSTTFRFNRSSLQYTALQNEFNEALRVKIKELAATRIGYGYRRLSVLLRREGWKVNEKRVHRLYRQEGLSLRAKAPKRRRRSAAVRVRIAPTGPNTVWSMDFMHDRLMGDRRQPFRILTIVDIVTRECLALEVAPGFRAGSVIHALSRIVQQRGAPIAIRCDQGTEFTAEALDQWAYANEIELDFSRPGKPTDNAFIESFNASVRKELLNTRWFGSLQEARRAAQSWRREYNEDRPHRSLSNKTPKAFAASAKEARSREISQSRLA
jgi:putative transposase